MYQEAQANKAEELGKFLSQAQGDYQYSPSYTVASSAPQSRSYGGQDIVALMAAAKPST